MTCTTQEGTVLQRNKGLSEQHLKEFDNILDCFGGSDGGARFFRLKTALETYEHDENPAAAELLKIMTTFSRLIDAVNR